MQFGSMQLCCIGIAWNRISEQIVWEGFRVMADKEEAMLAISSARKLFLETLGEAAARVEEVFCLQVFQTFQKQLALAQRRFKSLEEDRERDRAAWEEEKQALVQELMVWRSGVKQGIASLVPETCPEELDALRQNIHLRPRESELYAVRQDLRSSWIGGKEELCAAREDLRPRIGGEGEFCAVREDLRPGLGREERQQGEGCGGEPNLAILNPPVCQLVKEEAGAATAQLPSGARQEANVSDDDNLSGGGEGDIDQMRQALESIISKNRGGKDKKSSSQNQKRTPRKLQDSDEFIIPVIDEDIDTTTLRNKRRRSDSGDVITNGREPRLSRGDIVNSSPRNSNFHETGREDPDLDKLNFAPAAFVDDLESDGGGKARAHRAPAQPSTANHLSSMKENVDPQLQEFPKPECKGGPLSTAGNPAKPLEPSKKHQMQSHANKLAPAYKYVEPVRNQSDREALQGVQCKQCEKFYGAVHMQNADELVKNRCNHHDMSRHRYRHVPPATPEGFWNLGFDTDP